MKRIAFFLSIFLLGVVVSHGQATSEVTCLDSSASDQDDMCIWIHPTDESKSLIVSADKSARKLITYNLDGSTHQVITPGNKPGNIDIRYNFPMWNGQETVYVDLIGYNERATVNPRPIFYYLADPYGDRELTYYGAITTSSWGAELYGFCLYHSPVTGAFHAMGCTKSSQTRQYEISDANGVIQGILKRSIQNGGSGPTEGMVCDDEMKYWYAGNENEGIYVYDAEPNGSATHVAFLPITPGQLAEDVEGLAIYYAPNDTGYLVASSQGADYFTVFERAGWNFLGNFEILGVGNTDGIDVTNVSLDTTFSQGLLACHNGDANPYPVLLTEWEDIADEFAPNLVIDTAYWNPRARGVSLEAGFRSDRVMVAERGNVAFTDESDGDPTAWHWTFEGGVPSWSTSQNPTVSYLEDGAYYVALAVYKDGGSDAHLESGYIPVVDGDVVTVPVPSGGDDAEEREGDGNVQTVSTTLEPIYDGGGGYGHQTVGLRFPGIQIPAGSWILDAHVQFTAEDSQGPPVTVNIEGEAVADSAAFDTGVLHDISARSRTTAFTSWSLPAWAAGRSGVDQRTPGLKSIVLEIVELPGWRSGNAMTFIFTGADNDFRSAWSKDGNSGDTPPVLAIAYTDQWPGASATSRNGSGVNPTVFTSTSLPVLGTSWTSEIDGGSIGASGLTLVVGYSAPLSGVFLNASELLIDVTTPWAVTSISGGGSAISYHSIGIPSNSAFAGFSVYTQGLLTDLGGSRQLANAIDLVLGH